MQITTHNVRYQVWGNSMSPIQGPAPEPKYFHMTAGLETNENLTQLNVKIVRSWNVIQFSSIVANRYAS
jgi:hypothetical protein